METTGDAAGNHEELLRRMEALEQRLQDLEARLPAPTDAAEPAPALAPAPEAGELPVPDLASVGNAIAAVTARRKGRAHSDGPMKLVPSKPVTPPPLPEASASAQPIAESKTVPPKEESPARVKEDWMPRLRAAGLLPPERAPGDDFEKTLGTWWATRVGAVLAVLGAVFFAIHVSRDAGAGLRFLLLSAGSLATFGVGVWLERRLPSFGRVVVGMGLALLYYCAFAAYAVQAVRVTDNPVIAGVFQLLAAAGAMAYAARREAEPIAVMALLLGYLACWFSLHENLLVFAMCSSAVLVAAAAVLVPVRRWTTPWWITVAPHFVTVVTALLFVEHGMGFRIAVCLGSFLLFALPEWVMRKRGKEGIAPLARLPLFVGAGTSMLTLSATLDFPEDQAKWAFFIVGAFLCVWAWVDRLAGSRPVVSGALIAKGSGLIALGIILHFDTLARWMVLFVEATILLALWRRMAHGIVGMAFGILLGVAGGYYLTDVGAAVDRGMLSQALAFLFPAGVVILLAWGEGCVPKWSATVVVASAVFVGLLGIGWWDARGVGGGDVFALAGSVLVASVAVRSRCGWLSFPIMAVVWTIGLLFMGFPHNAWLLNGSAATCLCFIAARGVVVGMRDGVESDGRDVSWVASSIFVFVAVVVMAFTVRGTWDAPAAVVICTALYGVLALTATVLGLRQMACLAVVPLLIFWGIQVPLGPVQDVGVWGWAAYGLGLGVVWAAYRSEEYTRLVHVAGLARESVLIAHLSVLTLTGFATASQHGDGVKVLLAAVWAVALLPWAWGLQRGRGWRAPWYAGGVWLLWGSWHGILGVGEGWADDVLPGSLLVGAVLLFYPAIIKRLFPMRDRGTFVAVTSFIGIVFLLLLFITLGGQEQLLRKLVTVCWAGCALALVAMGLVERLKPFRIVGLAGLAFCLVRVFLVDVQSTTWRIAAFIGLGGLLLVVGFLYTRFAERLLGEEEVDDASADMLADGEADQAMS